MWPSLHRSERSTAPAWRAGQCSDCVGVLEQRVVKVLFLSSDFVYPADRGLRVRCLSQLRVLASLPEVQRIHLLALSEDPVVEDRLRSLEREVPGVVAEG